MSVRVIFHIDLDAFFAAVEQRDNPSLRGRPVIIGADPKGGVGRGVVSTCSYEARAFGVGSAMPISQAFRLCPSGVFLPPDLDKYQQVSEAVFAVFEEFSPQIEAVSIDEAFLEMTGSVHLFGTPLQAGQQLKARVRQATGLTASVGIAPDKMTAKIASDYCKPDGLLEVGPGQAAAFLAPLAIRRLWGVGPKTAQALAAAGIVTIGDAACFPPEQMRRLFGEQGARLQVLACGADDSPVEGGRQVQSVSNEETFDVDTEDQRRIFSALLQLSEKVSSRLRVQGLKGRQLTLKVRLTGFKTHTHCAAFAERTNHADKIFKKARDLFIQYFASAGTVRLVGVRVSDFDDGYVQDSLFAQGQQEQSQESVHQAVDRIRAKFGPDAIRRAGS